MNRLGNFLKMKQEVLVVAFKGESLNLRRNFASVKGQVSSEEENKGLVKMTHTATSDKRGTKGFTGSIQSKHLT